MKAITVLLASFAFGLPSVAPDIAPSPVPRKGEALAPRKATEVAMVAETVTLSLEEDRACVTASFTMKNTGGAEETLEVGFPTAAQPSSYSMGKEGLKVKKWGPASIDEFAAKVDGAAVTAESKDADRSNDGLRGWLCWPMTWQPGQTRTVDVSYSVATRDPNYTEPSPLRLRQVTYILKTGAGWHGNIGSARIVLKLGKLTQKHLVKVSPEPTRRSDDACEWDLKDFEPEADVLVEYRLFRDAKEARAKLEPLAAAEKPELMDVLDWAEAIELDGDFAAAGDAFMKLHALERDRKTFARHARGTWDPPAARAARLYKKAGDQAKTAVAAKDAVARLEAVIADFEDRKNLIMLRKTLRLDAPDLRQTLEECRALLESSN